MGLDQKRRSLYFGYAQPPTSTIDGKMVIYVDDLPQELESVITNWMCANPPHRTVLGPRGIALTIDSYEALLRWALGILNPATAQLQRAQIAATPRPIQAIVFDAFGTLCEIHNKRKPFKELARMCPDRKGAREILMTRRLGLRDAAAELHFKSGDLATLEVDLEIELASIALYDDVIETLQWARARGLKIAVASNLAAPYAAPLLRLLPFELDAYAWSFEIGYLKPDPRMLSWVCGRLGTPAHATLMIGDTFNADFEGALASGMQAIHLDRSGKLTRSVPSVRSLTELMSRALEFSL